MYTTEKCYIPENFNSSKQALVFKSLLKTLWEKEKLLVKSTFSFSQSVFYPFGKLSAFLYQI